LIIKIGSDILKNIDMKKLWISIKDILDKLFSPFVKMWMVIYAPIRTWFTNTKHYKKPKQKIQLKQDKLHAEHTDEQLRERKSFVIKSMIIMGGLLIIFVIIGIVYAVLLRE
jgi:hypothetical protein